MAGLQDFTTDALLTEIVRRRNLEETEQPIENWCEDCAHFKFSKSDRDTANNCSKKHVMLFRVPDDWPEEYGFYRRVCSDRTARHVAAEPALSPPPPPRAPVGSRPRLAAKS